MVYRTTSWLPASSFVFIWLPDLDFGLLIDQLARHEDDAHAPSGMSREKPSELLKRAQVVLRRLSDAEMGIDLRDHRLGGSHRRLACPVVTKIPCSVQLARMKYVDMSISLYRRGPTDGHAASN